MTATSSPPESPPDDRLARLEAALVARVGPSRYALWFQQAAFVPLGNDLAVVVANAHTQDWLARTFGDAVRAAAAESFGPTAAVNFVVEESLGGAATLVIPPELAELPEGAVPKPAKPQPAPAATLFEPARPLPVAPPSSGGGGKQPLKTPRATAEADIPAPPPKSNAAPQPHKQQQRRFKSLTDFVVGSSNRVAHASAVSVVEEPGQAANPLVLHGPVGTGKTHLLEGIYGGLRRQQSDLRATYVTAEEFTTRFVQAARFHKQGGFRRQFREAGALLLDDLHFLAGKKLTQEEFLHTFDALISDGRQVVVSMDCHPRLAEDLMPELADRLLGGAVWSLLPPDEETRLGILRAKAAPAGGSVPDDVLRHLAKHLKGNVRELEGAVQSLRHYAKVAGKRIDRALAQEALGDLLRHAVRTVTVGEIDQAVCRVLHLSSGTLQSKARSWAVSHPRAIAVYLARKHTSATYTEIARHFGAKTHSTAVACEKKVRAWAGSDELLELGERRYQARDVLERAERELGR